MEKQTILIADDNEINRIIICDMLEGQYELLEATNGVEAISAIQRCHGNVDLLLLDIVMPEMDGMEVLQIMKEKGWNEDIPVIMISAETSPEYIRRACELGAEDYVSRPFDPDIVAHRIRNAMFLHSRQKYLMSMVEEQFYSRERQNNIMITILSHIVEYRNGESGLHVLHINSITGILLSALVKRTDRYSIDEEDISLIRSASSLHDIGKISIPYSVLNKPGRLTPEEFEIIRSHPVVGDEMLRGLPVYRDEKLVRYAAQICRWHHERWDGRGYPDGLTGDEIPIAAQIVALADVYDALTSVRCYKTAYTHEEAVRMIRDGQCGSFNPLLLDCLTDVDEQLRELMAKDTDPTAYDVDADVFSRQILRKINEGKGEDVSRSARLLRGERLRQKYVSAFTDEAWFEYFSEPSMIQFNAAAQRLMDVPAEINEPLTSPVFAEYLGDGVIDKIGKMLDSIVNEKDEFETTIRAANGGLYRIRVGVMWSTHKDKRRIDGIVGRILPPDDKRGEKEEKQ